MCRSIEVMHFSVHLNGALFYFKEKTEMKIRTCSFFGDCDAPESMREKIRATLTVLIDCKINVFIVGNKGNFAKMVKEELMRLFPEYPWIFCFIMSFFTC